MKILVADDERIIRTLLRQALESWGHEIVESENGASALDVLRQEERPTLAILDWMMPDLDGVEVCRKVRSAGIRGGLYVILLTCRTRPEDIVEGLDAGADDYITKPFDPGELVARVRVGERVLALQQSLAARVTELEAAIARVRRLEGLLPICSYCKRIRDDQDYWQQIEAYISTHSEAQFSHGVCPDCFERVVRPELRRLAEREAQKRSEPETSGLDRRTAGRRSPQPPKEGSPEECNHNHSCPG